MVSNVSHVLLQPLIFWYCVKIVPTIKWWMENGDVANGDNNKIIFMPPRLQHGLPHGLNLNKKKKKKI